MNNQVEKLSKDFFQKMMFFQVILLTILLLLFGGSIYSQKKTTASQITKIVSGFIKSNMRRELQQTFSSVTSGNFKSVSLFSMEGKHILTIPPIMSPSFSKGKKSLFDVTLRQDVFFDNNERDLAGHLIFTFNDWAFLYWVAGIWFILNLFFIPFAKKYKNLLIGSIEREFITREKMAKEKQAGRVWHNIRQPLQLIKSLVENTKTMSNFEKEQLNFASEDIQGIVDRLKGKKMTIERHYIPVLLKQIVDTEKVKYQSLSDVQIELDLGRHALSSFARVSERELKEAISNLVDNSIKALKNNSGKVCVSLTRENGNISITVSDNGVGINKEQIASLGKMGYSIRPNGNGLGLNFVMDKVRSWNGEVVIESKLGEGTVVFIVLPEVAPPKWNIEEIEIKRDSNFAILDDRQVIHTLFKDKIQKELDQSEDRSRFFYNSTTFKNDLEKSGKENSFYFIDYDLGENEPTGVDVIEKNQLQKNAVLVTNHFDERKIQEECELKGIKMVAKPLLYETPFSIS